LLLFFINYLLPHYIEKIDIQIQIYRQYKNKSIFYAVF
jgi:hypothetical protein